MNEAKPDMMIAATGGFLKTLYPPCRCFLFDDEAGFSHIPSPSRHRQTGICEMNLEKSTHAGEWEKGKYYAAGETFTYKTLLFYVTEDHFADEDNHPRSFLHNERKDYPYKQVQKEM